MLHGVVPLAGLFYEFADRADAGALLRHERQPQVGRVDDDVPHASVGDIYADLVRRQAQRPCPVAEVHERVAHGDEGRRPLERDTAAAAVFGHVRLDGHGPARRLQDEPLPPVRRQQAAFD